MDALYTLQSEINLRFKKRANRKNLWLPPLFIDKHLVNSQQVRSTTDYWTNQAGLLKEKFRQVMQQLIEQQSQVKNLSALISLEELYELSLYSELDDSELRVQLQFEIGQTLCTAGRYDQAILIYQRIVRASSLYTSRDHYINVLKTVAKIYFQKGELKLALACYRKLLKESSLQTVAGKNKVTAQNPLLEILMQCAECLKKSGQFSQALYYYSQAEKLPLTPEAQQQVILQRVDLFHIKGNYRKAIKLLLPLLDLAATDRIQIYELLIDNSFLSGEYHAAEKFSRLKCNLLDPVKNQREYNLEKAKIGFIIYARDKVPVAPDYFSGAVTVYSMVIQSASENKIGKVSAFFKLAAIALMTGDIPKSIELHQKVLLICYEINNPELIAYTLILLSVDYSELGDYRQALKYSKKQLSVLLPLNNFRRIQECKMQIANLYQDLGEYDKSLTILQEISKTAESNDDLVILLHASLSSFENYLQQKRVVEAQSALVKYRQLCDQHKVKRYIHHYWTMLARYEALVDELDLSSFERINALFKKAIRLTATDQILKDLADLYYHYLRFLQQYGQQQLFKRTSARIAKMRLINCKANFMGKLKELIEQRDW